MLRLACVAVSLVFVSSFTYAQEKDLLMPRHAHGTFTAKIRLLTPPPADGLERFSMDNQIHGDLEATTKGEIFGMAGYVPIEVVTGILAGKHGSFALQRSPMMDLGRKMSISVVPGSGTGELKGIAGTFTIVGAAGQHLYDLEYTLPAKQ